MHFAYVTTSDRGATDRLLADVAQRALARGLNLSGVVQTNTPRPKSHHCDMDVQVLPDGPVIRISQDLGANARGCALDPEALERAVHAVAPTVTQDTDLLIINKFGKHEAEGRGFRETIAQALALDVPVLVGLNALNAPAFEAFTGGEGGALTPDVEAVEAWLSTCLQERRSVA
ncbi:DUF2478 domain-containing protein [Sediminimonas qiaohouensis]|uniref:DUF2478 domain-containing protein n=1 Tax=Sediminimonas qiaohouensis TaxID=552061 RepID=A0A7C9H9D7_9RHOB|nr:DUF2478 domain-containing protein [Sediminimonas qiaohouensis]MTJ03371.1 DUF2478 domain-containing protein [Sediminimonas qiaohouensis]